MKLQYQDLFEQVYDQFNRRDIDAVLLAMHPGVHWANGWEGGYVTGHDEIRNYWTRQWKELDPYVKPIAFKNRNNGQIEVEVHAIVKDIQGNLLSDGIFKHIYTLEDGLIKSMEIEEANK